MASITTSEIVGGFYVESAERFTFDNGETVSVSPDIPCDSPLNWGWDVEAYVYRSGYGMTLPDCEGSADTIAEAFAEYADNARRGEDESDLLARAERYARTFHGDTRVARLETLRGYSQGDWADIVFIGPDEDTVAMVAGNYGYYFRGDVWIVESNDDDYLAGIYADTAEEAATIYAQEMGW